MRILDSPCHWLLQLQGCSRSVPVAGIVDADRVWCGGVAASAMPACFTLSCSTGACGPAVALAGARTDCLALSSLNQAMALLASVAAITSAAAVRIGTNSWSCWFCRKRLIWSTSALSPLVSRSEAYCTSGLLPSGVDCEPPKTATLLRTSLRVVVHGNCVPVPPSLCIRSIYHERMIFRAWLTAQSRILSHALSRVGTRQLACTPSPGQNASDDNKGASAGSAVSRCMHAQGTGVAISSGLRPSHRTQLLNMGSHQCSDTNGHHLWIASTLHS